MPSRRQRRRGAAARSSTAVAVAVTAGLLASCTVSPPPAPQSTDTPSTERPPPPRPTQIIMAIDALGPGFNPHLLSDQSPVTAAVSALVLPSAFRPVPDTASPTGSRWELDPTLMVSAEVTDDAPFTVTYRIRPEAQWTDNAPIGADDFWFLWRQMVAEPGVVDPAGYDLVRSVQSVDGGKTAVVTFSAPYPAWRELFSDILPAHIVKDIPGGFVSGLARAMPVTGGRFRVESIDPQRDEVLLARNDRYWGRPAVPDQLLLRRAGAPAALADSVRNGDTQVAQVHGGATAFAQLSAIPDVRTARIMAPRTMQLSLRASRPLLADVRVRRALLGLLDVDLLAAVGAGSDNTVTLAQAQVRSPSDPGYVPTAPPALSREAATELLAQVGWRPGPPADEGGPTAGSGTAAPASSSPAPAPPPTPTPSGDAAPGSSPRGTVLTRDGEVLSFALGVADNDPTAVAVANTAADQLRSAGVAAAVVALDPRELYRDGLVDDRVDAVVGWRHAGGDLATLLASRFGCTGITAIPLIAGGPPGTSGTGAVPPGTALAAAPSPTAPSTTAPAPPSTLVQAPSNITGLCDEALQPQIDAALRGTADLGDVIDAAEPRLWDLATVMPILQDTTIVAAGPRVLGVSLGGAVPVGIVGDAGDWSTAR